VDLDAHGAIVSPFGPRLLLAPFDAAGSGMNLPLSAFAPKVRSCSMEQAAEILGIVNLVGFTLLAVVALRQWRLRRSEPAAWAAASFGGLGAVVLLSLVVREDPDTFFEHALQRADIIALLVFPYLLFRFTAAFGTTSRRLARLLSVVTLGLAVWTILLPEIPADDEPRPGLFQAYIVAFVVHWTILSVLAAWRLWRAGLGQPGVARRRMHMLSLAAAAITAAIILVAIASEPATQLASGVLATISALAFLLGLAPPTAVRVMWRRREQAELQRAVSSLMELASSEQEVADRVLRPTAAIVGARGVEVRNNAGEVIGSHGDTGEARSAETIAMPGGSLSVWTSPYAPFFGDEELRLLRTLGSLTGLALDRARLFEQERDARLVLERAERLKTDFIALAAHELRTPVATVFGIAKTFQRPELGADRREQLQELLVEQIERLALLVDQLLDLSRLDAEAVSILPERFAVRDRVAALVASAAGAGEGSVEVAIEPALEAVADPHAFDRIVSNLVANALRHGGPPVVVAAQQTDRHFRLSVEDHGRGVPPEFVADLFERFTRGGRAHERASGTGLGLAIARSYAQAHSGDLRYEPAEPTGSRFLLVLPVGRES
jgi:signal transduction histidine kinase